MWIGLSRNLKLHWPSLPQASTRTYPEAVKGGRGASISWVRLAYEHRSCCGAADRLSEKHCRNPFGAWR